MRSGQVQAGDGFEYWLLKFDGVSGNRDKELEDPKGYGLIEYAYYLMALACGYEQALLVMRQLQLPMQAVEQLFRRMVFNIVARNKDDHVKNIAFLMNRSGEWSLSPAFDMTYSFNPDGAWTASHQMTMNGKRENFTMADFKACARAASMKRGRAASIVADVQARVSEWGSFAQKAGVPDSVSEKIQHTLNLKPF